MPAKRIRHFEIFKLLFALKKIDVPLMSPLTLMSPWPTLKGFNKTTKSDIYHKRTIPTICGLSLNKHFAYSYILFIGRKLVKIVHHRNPQTTIYIMFIMEMFYANIYILNIHYTFIHSTSFCTDTNNLYTQHLNTRIQWKKKFIQTRFWTKTLLSLESVFI